MTIIHNNDLLVLPQRDLKSFSWVIVHWVKGNILRNIFGYRDRDNFDSCSLMFSLEWGIYMSGNKLILVFCMYVYWVFSLNV